MKMKKAIILIASACPLWFVHAATQITATNSGSWDDSLTWGGGEITTDSAISINRDVEVTLDSGEYTVAKLTDSGKGDGTGPAKLIITGEGTSLTFTENSQLYYDSRLDLQILDGAKLIAKDIQWGSNTNAASKITVSGKGSYFEADLHNQLKGSGVEGYGIILVEKGASAGGSGRWDLNPQIANQSMTVKVDGISDDGTTYSSLNTGSHDIWANASSGSTAKVIASNGGKINVSGLSINYKTGSSNIVQVYGANSKLTTSSRIYVGDETTPKAENTVAKITFGGYENDTFVAATNSSMYGGHEVFVRANGALEFLLGTSNAASDMSGGVIFDGKYFKQVKGDILVDFANVLGLDEGTYYFGLISSTQSFWYNQDADYDFADHIIVSGLASNMTYGGVSMSSDNKQLFVKLNVSSIPEPSTYAAIFGALALAFVAYRRRK